MLALTELRIYELSVQINTWGICVWFPHRTSTGNSDYPYSDQMRHTCVQFRDTTNLRCLRLIQDTVGRSRAFSTELNPGGWYMCAKWPKSWGPEQKDQSVVEILNSFNCFLRHTDCGFVCTAQVPPAYR